MDVLESDVKIIDISVTVGNTIKFPAEYMPDGEEFSGQIPPDGINNELLQTWCGHVRSQYDAREESKRATESSRNEATGTTGGQQAADTSRPSKLHEAAKEDIPEAQASLYQILVVRREVLIEELRNLELAHADLVVREFTNRDAYDQQERELVYVEEMLHKMGDSYDASEDCEETRTECIEREEQEG